MTALTNAERLRRTAPIDVVGREMQRTDAALRRCSHFKVVIEKSLDLWLGEHSEVGSTRSSGISLLSSSDATYAGCAIGGGSFMRSSTHTSRRSARLVKNLV